MSYAPIPSIAHAVDDPQEFNKLPHISSASTEWVDYTFGSMHYNWKKDASRTVFEM